MSDTTPFGFGKFVPGFDFLQNLAKGASGNMAQMPNLSSWIAPTISIEDLDKRVQELKAVQFWLEQNSRALSATIQALEVQRMTLATLKGMNMSFNDLAESLKVKPQAETSAFTSPFNFTPASEAAPQAAPTPEPAAPAPEAAPKAKRASAKKTAAGVDPAHWWGALTDQFQTIAKHAMTDMAHRANAHDTAHKTAHKTADASGAAPAARQAKPKAKPAAKRVRKPAAKRSSKPAAR